MLWKKNNIKQGQTIPDGIYKSLLRYIKSQFPNIEDEPRIKNVVMNNFKFQGNDSIYPPWYNSVRQSDYDSVKLRDYLRSNIKIEHMDWKKLVDKYSKNKNYWNLTDTCDIIDFCINHRSILFESDKSELLPLVKLITKYKTIHYTISSKIKLSIGESYDYYILFNV